MNFALSNAVDAPLSQRRADLYPGGGERSVRLGDRRFAEVEDRGGEDRVGMPLDNAGDEMVEIADAAACDHRHRYRIGDRRG